MKSFGKQLDELMSLVQAGDLEEVQQHVESIPSDCRRPLIESCVVGSFKRGAKNEIVAWLASEIGTLKLTVSKMNNIDLILHLCTFKMPR
jgi:hypothetical protein